MAFTQRHRTAFWLLLGLGAACDVEDRRLVVGSPTHDAGASPDAVPNQIDTAGGPHRPQGGDTPSMGGSTMPAGGATGTTGQTTPKGESGATGAGTGSMSMSTAGSTTTNGGSDAPAAGTGGMSMGSGGCGGTNDGSTATAGESGGICAGAGTAKEGTCKAMANGVYAVKVDLDVWFMDEVNDPGFFDPGRAKLSIYFRDTITDICDDGSNGKAIAHPCGMEVPGLYASAATGVIQVVYPGPDVWDRFPDYVTTGHTTGFNPGDTLTIDKTTALLGISLPTADSAWPTYMETPTFLCREGNGDACFPDVDRDGKPGITVTIQSMGTPASPGYGSGWKYVPAPTSLVAAVKYSGANLVYTGMRNKVGGSGMIGADCKSGIGAADSDDVESRVQGCVNTDGSMCSSSDATFVDKNTPIFHVLKVGEIPQAKWLTATDTMSVTVDKTASIGPKSSVVRLGDATAPIKCEDVLSAFSK